MQNFVLNCRNHQLAKCQSTEWRSEEFSRPKKPQTSKFKIKKFWSAFSTSGVRPLWIFTRRDHCFFNWHSVGGGVQVGSLGNAATDRPIVPAPGDYDDGKIGGMIGRGNRNIRRKPTPMPLCPPQTPHAARTRTLASAVGSQRLTVWAVARP
jgi:hypothetical protein